MNFVSLSELQSRVKFRTIPVYEKSIVNDLQRGKFSVMVVECNLQRAYGSPIHKMALRTWPELIKFGPECSDRIGLGSIENYKCPGSTVNRIKQVTNLYSGQSVVGIPIPGSKHLLTREERFCAEAFKAGLSRLIREIRESYPSYDLDRQIAVQRFGGGFAGHEWEDVQSHIDEVCAEHQINILAYLPKQLGSTNARR